jgi:hypothetical protein
MEKKYIAKADKFLLRVIKDNSEYGMKYRYMLLSRMKSDCDYYLGNGHRAAKYLWGLDESEHIIAMYMIYDSFEKEQKPEWLTVEQLNNYEKQLLEG